MSEHGAMEPNKPALAILAIAGLLIAISITSVLVIPGLQPKFIPIPAGGTTQPSTTPAGQAVTIIAPIGSGINEINFAPHDFVLVIGVNNTIVLKNQDTADHTITSNPGDPVAFDTGDISGLSSSSPITFTTPGTYAYHCQFHPAYMHGTITVVAGT